MVRLALANSRMKDFFDIRWLEIKMPLALTDEFGEDTAEGSAMGRVRGSNTKR